MMRTLKTLLFLITPAVLNAAADSSRLQFGAYMEAYYGYDLNEPDDHRRPNFLYSYNRHNELSINLAFLKASYKDEKVRANLAFMTGTYANSNLASETPLNRMIFEANAGFRLTKKHDLWIDAGVLPSHIGFETPVGKDCPNLSRSLLAENSPYYEAGVRLSYTSRNEKWYAALLYLNGWQKIQRLSGYNYPSMGTQLTYKSEKLTLNHSSFVGSLYPDQSSRMRIYNNLFAVIKATDKLEFTTGLDFGLEQSRKGSGTYHSWYSPVIIGRLAFGKKSSIAGRFEYFSDPENVVINSADESPVYMYSASVNYDLAVNEKLLWRVEARGFSNNTDYFKKLDKPVSEYLMLTSAICFSF